MPLDFTAIDFETANGSPASACAIGLTKVRGGRIVDQLTTLIRPPAGHDEFSPFNIQVHGIYPNDVMGAPTWPEVTPELLEFVDGDVIAAHNASFDTRVLAAINTATGQAAWAGAYACSLRIARRTYHLDSYRLPNVALAAGVDDFAHHDAGADAAACAGILIHAARRHEADTIAALANAARAPLAPLR